MRTRRAVAIAILLTSTSLSALAQTSGGAGGVSAGPVGSGGVSSATGAGGTGGDASGGNSGGGGGGAGATGGAGGSGSGVSPGVGRAGGASAGAAGTAGANGSTPGGGGGGGGGAHGVVVTSSTSNSGAVTGGGGGGGGGASGIGGGGGGGAGGYGVVANGAGLTTTNNGAGAITGGTGGAGGAATSVGNTAGDGGGGGYGVFFTGIGTINNAGTITGGNGGAGGVGTGGAVNGVGGLGGQGIIGSGITVINSGTITGGLDGDGVTREDAIQFTGGTNILTLQSGSSITGNVVAFSTSDTLALGGSTNSSFDVSNIGAAAQYQGFGVFEKTGTSTWTLTNTTASITNWTVNAGTLSISSSGNLGAAGSTLALDNGTTLAFTATGTYSHAVTLTGDPTFDVASGQTVTYSAVIADGGSAGTLEKTDTGTLILTAANSYTGGTTISAGTLQTTGSGTLGAISGSVTVSGGTLDLGTKTQTQNGGVTLTSGTIQNGTLSSSGAFSLQTGTVAAVLTGSGALTKSGAGAVVLSGANTYTGGTTISAGTLTIGASGSLSSAGTLIVNGGTINFNGSSQSVSALSGTGGTISLSSGVALTDTQSGTTSYAGTISSLGGLVFAGSGTLTLSGANTYTGNTTVSAGTLTVMGSLAGPVTINGGKLNGTGTVGAVTISSGGTLAPGDAIGTLHVNGNLSFAAGSGYAVEVSPTAADETIATGAVTLGSNVNLAITQDAGTYTAHDYTLISAASVSGTFATVTGNSFTGLNSTIQYSATGVDLILTALPSPAPVTFLFGTYGQTSDQVAAGNAVTAGSATGALYTNLGGVVTRNTGAVPATLAQLSGDIHASLRSAMIEDGKIIRDTVINHAIASNAGITVWGAGFGSYGAIDGDSNAADVHHHDSGVMLGADMPVMDGIDVGLGVALTDQTISVPSETASASGSTNHIIGYANWTDSAWVASLGWDCGWGANQMTRQITTFSETDTDHQSNRLAQVFGEVGYKIPSGVIALEPYLDLANVSARTGAFTETGGMAALSGGARSGSENYATVGVRATLAAISIAGISMVPDFNLGWQHAFTRFMPRQALLFASAGESFAVAGVPLDTDAAAMQAGLDVILTPTATLDIGYDGNVSGRVEDHAGRIGLDWKL